MPGDVIWTMGLQREYELFSNALNESAKNGDGRLERLRDAMREGQGVMPAYFEIFDLPTSALKATEQNWFGIGGAPQWLWDSTLTTGQMHQVMVETTARIAELMLAGAGPVSIYLQCGHPRFRTLMSWKDAAPEHAGATWPPTKASGELRVWVHTPFSSGYAHKLNAPTADAKAMLDDLIARATRAGDPARMDPPMTIDELDVVVDGFPPAPRSPWQGTVLGQQSDAATGTLTLRYLPELDEPLPDPPREHHEDEDEPAKETLLISPRTVPAIEISCVSEGALVFHGRSHYPTKQSAGS